MKENEFVGILAAALFSIGLITPVLYIVYAAYWWLKYGGGVSWTACERFGVFCSNHSSYLGANKIMDAIGYGSPVWFFLLISASCLFVAFVLIAEANSSK